jgi:hypothetical protein
LSEINDQFFKLWDNVKQRSQLVSTYYTENSTFSIHSHQVKPADSNFRGIDDFKKYTGGRGANRNLLKESGESNRERAIYQGSANIGQVFSGFPYSTTGVKGKMCVDSWEMRGRLVVVVHGSDFPMTNL